MGYLGQETRQQRLHLDTVKSLEKVAICVVDGGPEIIGGDGREVADSIRGLGSVSVWAGRGREGAEVSYCHFECFGTWYNLSEEMRGLRKEGNEKGSQRQCILHLFKTLV